MRLGGGWELRKASVIKFLFRCRFFLQGIVSASFGLNSECLGASEHILEIESSPTPPPKKKKKKRKKKRKRGECLLPQSRVTQLPVVPSLFRHLPGQRAVFLFALDVQSLTCTAQNTQDVCFVPLKLQDHTLNFRSSS